MRKFESIDPVSREDASVRLRSQDPGLIAKTLVSLGMYDEDWKWIQQECLQFLTHESEVVVSAAILSLGHIARVNKIIDKETVIPHLRSVASDIRYAGKVQDVLDDIYLFAKADQPASPKI